jgi:hypothetical protein
MNRWSARILGFLMVVIFLLLLMNLQKQLLMLQRERNANPVITRT